MNRASIWYWFVTDRATKPRRSWFTTARISINRASFGRIRFGFEKDSELIRVLQQAQGLAARRGRGNETKALLA